MVLNFRDYTKTQDDGNKVSHQGFFFLNLKICFIPFLERAREQGKG